MSDENLLREKARQWAQLVVKLHNTHVPRELENEKQALLKFAQKIKEAVEGIVGVVPELDPMNQLGVIPVVVGVVGVAGAIAAITKWTYDYKRFTAKLSDRDSLIASGMSAKEATQLTNAIVDEPTMFGAVKDVKSIVTLAALGFGAYILAKKMRVI